MRSNRAHVIRGLRAVATLMAVVLMTAAFVGSIRNVFHRTKRAERSSIEEERARVRKALAGLTVTFGADDFSWLPELADDFDREAFLASLPVLDPPLSQTIIDMRDEEG